MPKNTIFDNEISNSLNYSRPILRWRALRYFQRDIDYFLIQIYYSMKALRILLLLVFLQLAASTFNTTEFWKKSLNSTEPLHFEAYSGFQQIDWYRPRGTSGMHYQLFGAMGSNLNETTNNIPLIIWLNGGPGSSSLFGAFNENGPIRILENKTKLFDYPWNFFGHMLYIDQPLNVGFSFSGNRTSGKQVSSANEGATHLLNFLYNFYREWPKLANCPLYIVGESYGGHYVPAFARTLVLNDTFKAATKVDYRGIALGDGWVDPINQFNFYDSLLYSAGIVSNKFRDVCTWVQTQGMINIYKEDYKNATIFWDYLTNNQSVWDTYMGGISEFNFRQYDQMDSTMEEFLEKNKASLGVPSDVKYIAGNEAIYDSFQQDISRSYTSDISILLRHGRVLIYNGQEDYVVNTAGVLTYLNSLRWEGIESWKRARKQIWRINNQISGWAKVSGNLWFVLVNKAGHLVPTDNPQAAFNMFGHFIRNDRDWNQ